MPNRLRESNGVPAGDAGFQGGLHFFAAFGHFAILCDDDLISGNGGDAARFGRDALRFVNSPTGIELSLRGINARVVVAGKV